MTNFMNHMVSPGTWNAGMIVVWVLVVAVIIALGVLVYRLLSGDTRPGPGVHDLRRRGGDGTGLGSLERRYAAGQIGDEEFERRRETILAGRGRSA